MSAEFCFTDAPEYILHKDYEGKPDVDKLHEIFVIVYSVETPTKDLKESARYIFIKSLEKAMRQWKLFGPRSALLHRIFTDDDDINQLALDNENKKVEDVVETESLSSIKAPENDKTIIV
jgi:hypothetical protein